MAACFGVFRSGLWGLVITAATMAASPIMAQTGAPPSSGDLEKWYTGSRVEELETDDGVYLSVRYWEPQTPSKDTPVVLLIHPLEKDSSDWAPLANHLFQSGFAVVTFDFRGHGASLRVNPDVYKPLHARRGQRNQTDITHGEEFRNPKEAIVLLNDLDRVKHFILEQNNAGKLNARRLGIITAGGFAGVLALEFAQQEYEVGQADLNAMVMILPASRVAGLSIPYDFDKKTPPEDKLPILIISGQRSNLSNFARSLKVATTDDIAKLKDRFGDGKNDWWLRGNMRREAVWLTFDAQVPFSQMLKDNTDNIDGIIGGYLKNRLTGDEKKGLSWASRETVEKKPGGTFGSSR